MPIAHIQILEGRSAPDRKKLIAQASDAIVTSLGVEPTSARDVVIEVSSENRGVGGVTKSAALPR